MKIQNLLIAAVGIAVGVWAYKKYVKKDDVVASAPESKMSNCCGA
jgi:hypothetical protein